MSILQILYFFLSLPNIDKIELTFGFWKIENCFFSLTKVAPAIAVLEFHQCYFLSNYKVRKVLSQKVSVEFSLAIFM